jgi:hypothetical protein
METLARVLDKDAIEGATGPAACTSVRVPREWLARGDVIELVVPARLACARCEGGGCDQCNRSGGLRIEGDEAARRIRIGLPKRIEGSAFSIRLLSPLGDGAMLDVLVVEIVAADAPSESCTRVETREAGRRSLRPVVMIGFVVLAAIAAIAAATGRLP